MSLKNDLVSKIKPFIKKFFGIPLTILSFLFIGKIIFDNWQAVAAGIKDFNLLLFFFGIFLLSLYFPIRGIIWHKLLKIENHNISQLDSLYFLSLSEIKRYTPGNIFSFIARTLHFEKIGIPRKTTATLLGIEIFFMVVAASLTSLPSVSIISNVLDTLNAEFIKLPTMFFFIFIIAAGLFLIYKKAYKKFAYEYINILLLTALSWIIFGIGNYLIASSLTFLSPRLFIELSSFFIFSWLIGYLTLITPMGLGVREAIVIFGLAPLVGAPIASTIAIMLRIGFIFGELLTLLSLRLFRTSKLKHLISTKKNFLNAHTFSLILCLIAFIGYFSFFAIEKHNNFFTGRYDLGNMDQTIWNTLNGKIFMFTNPDTNEFISRLSVHADFLLIFLSPFYFVWSDPRMLLLIQTIVIAIGSIFVYLISDKILSNRTISLILGASYLLNPFIQKQALFDFHAVTLATTFLLAAWFFLEKNEAPRVDTRGIFSSFKGAEIRRSRSRHSSTVLQPWSSAKEDKIKLFIVCLLIAALTKENVWVITGMIGLYAFFFKEKKIGILISVVSFSIFYLLVSYFIPQARGTDHFALEYYKEFGDSPINIIKSLLIQPQLLFQKVLSMQSLEYLKIMFIPVGFLSLVAPQYLLLPISDFAINLLSNNKNLRSIDFHYAATIIPFIYISAIYGIKNILAKIKLNPNIIVYFIIIFIVYSTYYYSVLPGTKKAAYEIYERRLPYAKLISSSLSKIPENATVSASNNLGPHLTHRRNIFTVPNGIKESEYVAFLLTDTYAAPSLSAQRDLAQSLKSSGNYIILVEEQDFLLLKKITQAHLDN